MGGILNAYKITLDNGTSYVTSMSATLADATTYFLGTYINLGDTEEHPADEMVRVVAVEQVR